MFTHSAFCVLPIRRQSHVRKCEKAHAINSSLRPCFNTAFMTHRSFKNKYTQTPLLVHLLSWAQYLSVAMGTKAHVVNSEESHYLRVAANSDLCDVPLASADLYRETRMPGRVTRRCICSWPCQSSAAFMPNLT